MRACALSGGKPPSSCPAKAGHPVRRNTSDEPLCPGILDRPPSRTMTGDCKSAMFPAMTNHPFFPNRGDGLLAHAIEERHGSDEFVPARLTVDMFRLPNILTPVEITTTLIRDGKRIK